MSMTDPISDMLTRLRNAIAAEHDEVEIPASKLKAEVARILKEEGYIEDWTVEPAPVGKTVKIKIKYTGDHRSVISGLERVSKPGRRHYVKGSDVPRVLGGMGTAILSTSRGVMSGNEARRRGVGGELIANVW